MCCVLLFIADSEPNSDDDISDNAGVSGEYSVVRM